MGHERWWYLSYAGDDGFHGACIVRGQEIVTAAQEAHRLRISPGGQVLGSEIPDEELPEESFRERLLTEADVKACWSDAASLAEHVARS